ncbi:PREDICTED: F-box/LRR-repeat protein 13 [Myotis davidii]|uniref:F-box/LRR-repeat protein 13 n=1 Tax=Myotis davidii TaxID=225400 RepID=UPI0003EC0DCD|nr:PREDICTED: F-box/LRR-repeat protein 13 [Myotis davidii]
MIIIIMKNGLESLLWDMCIDPSMKPKVRRLSETYLEQLFGLDDQLVRINLMIKACTFYTGHLVKSHFSGWKDIAIPRIREEDIIAKKMEIAIKYDNLKLQKYVFYPWHSYVKSLKEQIKDALLRIQQIFHNKKLIITLHKWRDKAIYQSKKREEELLLKHEVQLKKWRNRIRSRGAVQGIVSVEDSRSGDYFVGLCKNLQELNVSDCSTLTDESMKHISECCPGILYLNLSYTAITNRTMRLLPRHFHNLQNLSLAYCRKFTDKGLRYLNLGHGCHKLIYLDLSGCTQISVQGFRNIANSCTGIMHLIINDMPTLTDNCLKALVEHCLRITSVVFIGSPHISDLAFKVLSKCNLRKIRFEGNKRITDSCFKHIDKHYPNISHIYMANCKGITDSSLKSLSPLKQLSVLNLANCIRIGDTGLKQFLDGPSSTKLRELNLSNCIQVGDASILRLAERCPNLNYLSLRNCEQLTDSGVEYIINIYSLISLDLSGTYVSNKGLSTLSRHKKLKELSLSECYEFTNYGIQVFCRVSQILEQLDVSYCTQLSDEFITTLSIYCLNLTFLSIAGCTQITDSAVEVLSAKCHYLHILDISGCPLLTDEIFEFLQMGCQQLRILRMEDCSLISREAAMKMSSIVQQEYNPTGTPAWSSYDDKGKHATDGSGGGGGGGR